MITNLKTIFPNESYTENDVYEIAEANDLQVDDTPFNTFTILEVVQCDHLPDDPTGHSGMKRYGDCDFRDDDHEVLGECRNDVGGDKLLYLEILNYLNYAQDHGPSAM